MVFLRPVADLTIVRSILRGNVFATAAPYMGRTTQGTGL
ncbi:hypothetical protein TH47_02790 [Thalassospira sp. MCCC 1A02803]|nr:hypothetical protein TH47_02790 [Thalassospira sp. MCCC 1A02803]